MSPDDATDRLDHVERLVWQGSMDQAAAELGELWPRLAAAPPAQRARCQNLLARTHENRGELAAAMLACYSALELYVEADDPVGRVRVLSLAGVVAARLNDVDHALDLVREAHDLAGTAVPDDDTDTHFRLHNNTALMFETFGQLDEAVDYYDSALEVVQIGDPVDGHLLFAQAMPLWTRLHAAVRDDDARRVHELLPISLALVERCRDGGWNALVSEGQRVNGMAYLAVGDTDAALECLEDAVAVARQDGNGREQVAGLLATGRAEIRSEALPAALGHLTAALDLAQRERDHPNVVEAHRLLAEAHEANGDPAPALVHLRRYVAGALEAVHAIADSRAQLISARIVSDRSRHESKVLRRYATSLREQNAELSRDATLDPLTGVGNRRFLDVNIHRLRSTASAPLVIVVADIDHFKTVNDTFSHAVGDDVLRIVARLLTEQCRPGDLVVRYGGEEFVLALGRIDLAAGVEVSERLRRAVEGHEWTAVAPGLAVTMSVGVAEAAGPETFEAVLSRADAALYAAKRAGRNTVVAG